MISLSSRRNHYSEKYFTMLHTQSEGTRVRFPTNQGTITKNDTMQVQLAICLFKNVQSNDRIFPLHYSFMNLITICE